ncbi:MAG: bifunctional oligoribonuclease/PAP phosphatase NrnA [Spirochaetota bacterium]
MKFDIAKDFISQHSHFIITAHETPDGDAIGSECAVYRGLQKMGKRSLIFNADPIPQKFKFLDPDGNVNVLASQMLLPKDISEYVLLMLDTNDTHNIGIVADYVLPVVKDYLIIDHHENGGNTLTANLIIEEASSTCEILYDLFSEIGVEIDFLLAQALYVGIVYDTGSFIYPKTTAKTFSIAHVLVENGVNPNDIYSRIYESNSISSLVLQSKVLSTLELHFDKQVAIQTMLKETIIQCNASYEEADTLINIPLKSERIRVSIFFKENLEGILRCSLRSKGNINVAEISQIMGGGGHKTASGFKCKLPLEEVKKKVLEMLKVYF